MSRITSKEVEWIVSCIRDNHPDELPVPDWMHDGNNEPVWNRVLENVDDFREGQLKRRFSQRDENDGFDRREEYSESQRPYLRKDLIRAYLSHDRMVKSEAKAIEFALRLKPWGGVAPLFVTWHFVTSLPTYIAFLGGPFDFAIDMLWESLECQGHPTDEAEDSEFWIPRKSAPTIVRKTLQANAGWHFAIENDLWITGPNYAMPKNGAKRFSDLQNPFESLIEIWQYGCFITTIPYNNCHVLKLAIVR